MNEYVQDWMWEWRNGCISKYMWIKSEINKVNKQTANEWANGRKAKHSENKLKIEVKQFKSQIKEPQSCLKSQVSSLTLSLFSLC